MSVNMVSVHDVRSGAQCSALQEYIDTILLVVIVQTCPQRIQIGLELIVRPKLQAAAQGVALTVFSLDGRASADWLEDITIGKEIFVPPSQPRVLLVDAILSCMARSVSA